MAESSGPTAAVIPVSSEEWSSDHLYIHLSGKIEDLKASLGDLRSADAKAIDAALAAQEKAVATALVAAEKAVITALASAEKAVSAALAAQEKATDKYEREVERWRANSNEWRQAMLDRERTYLQIDSYNAAHDPLIKDVADIKQSRDRSIGLSATVDAQAKEISDLQEFKNKALGRMAAQTGIGTALAVAISIALRFLG